MKYVALLRGINVGGNNKIEMKKLKLLFEELGFNSVETYINSGNVIFKCDNDSLLPKIESAINSRFNLSVKTLVLSKNKIKAVVDSIPKGWIGREDWRQNVLFLWPESDSKDILNLIENKDEVDEVRYVPGALLWATNKDYLSRSGGQKLVGSKLYNQMTVRNLNTTLKIWEMLSS